MVDGLLEATVVGSFARTGIAVRRSIGRRAGTWGRAGPRPGGVAVVTGGTSGIGLALASALAACGTTVHLVGRRAGPAEEARRLVADAAGPGGPAPLVGLADLADPADVGRLAAEVADAHPAVDLLVHAAGTLLHERRTGPDGTEATVAVHVLAPFLLTALLRPRLAAAGAGRVVTVTSGGCYTQRFDLGALDPGPGSAYDGTRAYARAKRAQVVLTTAWASRLAADGTTAHVAHPGWVDTPGLRRGLPRFASALGPLLRTPAEGADTLLWLAGAPAAVVGSGHLWHDRRCRSPYRLPWTWVPPAARGAEADALWAWCLARPAWAPPPAAGGAAA